MLRLHLLLLLLASAASAMRLTEIAPLKAAMLVRSWQGLLAEVDQKVGVVPELGSSSVGIRRFGPELERRTLCKKQYQLFYEATFGLATADKSDSPAAKRGLVPALNIGGAKRGERSAVYASLAAPATLSIVERRDSEWSVLALTVNPTERDLETIVGVECTALQELRALAEASDASLRIFADAEATLAGDLEQLGLEPLDADAAGTPLAVPPVWYGCVPE